MLAIILLLSANVGLSAAEAQQPQLTTDPHLAKPLFLTCFGGGTGRSGTVSTVWANGGTANITGWQNHSFSDQVDVRLFTSDDRIRMPRSMSHGIGGGGNDGWSRLKNIVANERSISGSVSYGAFNNPKFHLDRVTGTISISGKGGNFSGQCSVVDESARPKF